MEMIAYQEHVFFRGINNFVKCRESEEDADHERRPRTAQTPEMIEKMREFVANDRNATTRMIAEDLGISKYTVSNILSEDLGKKKVCARFVPHSLRDHKKVNRVQHCRDVIAAAGNDPNFLESIVTGDETWR